jgi:hypothetical protein
MRPALWACLVIVYRAGQRPGGLVGRPAVFTEVRTDCRWVGGADRGDGVWQVVDGRRRRLAGLGWRTARRLARRGLRPGRFAWHGGRIWRRRPAAGGGSSAGSDARPVSTSRARSASLRLGARAWLRRRLNASGGSTPRRSASIPLACSTSSRLVKAPCSCCERLRWDSMTWCCRRPMVATSARPDPAAGGCVAAGRRRRRRGSTRRWCARAPASGWHVPTAAGHGRRCRRRLPTRRTSGCRPSHEQPAASVPWG